MIVNNLQKKPLPNSKDNEKVSRKILILVSTSAKCNATCTQNSKYGDLQKKCEISKAREGREDDLFQKDSFASFDNNFKDYSPKKVRESF